MGTRWVAVVMVLVAACVGAALVWAQAQREEIKPLTEMELGRNVWRGPVKETIGGEIWDNCWYVDPGYQPVVIDTGGGWDLLEMWVGLSPPPWQLPRVSMAVYVDGERVGSHDVRDRAKVDFFSVPLNGGRAVTIVTTPEDSLRLLRFVNPRLVRGRTEPAQPTDLSVRDGELVYVERPGEYRIRVLR